MKHRPSPNSSPASTEARVDKAAREGRFQHALQLARQLYIGDQSPAHKDLLFNASLGRARQLRGEGKTRDAVGVLDNAAALAEGVPAWAEQVAGEYLACGQPGAALRLTERSADAVLRGRILAKAVDVAFQLGASGRDQLPEDLRPGFDRILQAFEQCHAGQDEVVRATLQEIGLQSPFLEWKLLLRGLQAYCAGDDARALENWSRLSGSRLVGKLSAPLRFRIDPVFVADQTSPIQATLQRQGDLLHGSSLMALLRPLQAALARDDLKQAFRLADKLLPQLRAEFPDLVPRLAACFYAAIVRAGSPQDVDRYPKLFELPADDREFHRMKALACERAGEPVGAHCYWQDYDQWVEAHPEIWAGQAERVRAMIWCRMAQNAADVPDAENLKMLPDIVRKMAPVPSPLEPAADACFRRSLELAPDVLETHVALVDFHRRRGEDDLADAAARRLLERFPSHAATLSYLGERCLSSAKPGEGLALLERAYRANPLERRLRGRMGVAHLQIARTHLETKHLDQARAEYRTALEYCEGEGRFLPLCQWAICEALAGDSGRSEELFGQARALAGHPLPTAFAGLAEAIRGKLAANRKRDFEKALRDALGGDPDPRSAVLCLEILAAYKVSGISYRGQKSHENQLIAYLERISIEKMGEPFLEQSGKALLLLGKFKQVRAWAAQAGRQWPRNPWFPFIEAEGFCGASHGKTQQGYRVHHLLNRARTLAQDLPADEGRGILLASIDERLQQGRMARLLKDPFALSEMLQSMGGFGFRNDDDDDDDDDAF